MPSVETGHAPSLQTTLLVYDVLGREVAILVNQKLQPGNHEIFFDASNLSSGMYIYKINTGEFTSVKKMLLIR
ncbi:MAG: T9SS type A sorting domain-containing protein [Melioribacteraceae bacterium]|nr:T9SS type A sorting domain-containing protein [Melioribacteraceae bacterium]